MRILAKLLLLLWLPLSAQAADCVSSVATLAQPQQFPNRVAASIAWTGSVLGVAKNDSDTINTNAIYFAAYDGSFNPVVADHVAVPTSLAGAVALVWNGTDFGLFFQTKTYQLMLQRINTDGTTLGAPIPIAPNHLQWADQEFDIVWDPSRSAYVIARSVPNGFEKGLWLTETGRDGSLQFDQQVSFFTSTTVVAPRVALANNGRIGIIWMRTDPTANDVLTLLVLDANNTTAGGANISTTGHSAVIASNGTQFLVADSAPITGGTEVRVAVFDTTARQLVRESSFIPPTGVDVAPVSLVWNPALSEWALLYSDSLSGFTQFPGRLRLRRFPSIDATASDTLFSPTISLDTVQARGRLVAANTSYFAAAAIFFSKNDGSSSYLIKLCALTTSAHVNQTYAQLYVPVQFTAPTSGGVPGYSYDWYFGDLSPHAQGPSPSHAFAHVGTYTVTVTATDSAGAISSATTQVIVTTERHRGAKK